MSESVLAFPCWSVKFSQPVKDVQILAKRFVEERPDDSWVLLSQDAAISDKQLWTAWVALGSGYNNETMRSTGIDGEFIRLIAGTHQVRVGFERAGISAGDEGCWLIHLPDWKKNKISPNGPNEVYPEIKQVELSEIASRMLNVMQGDLRAKRPHPTENTVRMLCLETNGEDWIEIEKAGLAHISLADL